MSVSEITADVEQLLLNTPLNVELESEDGTDLLIYWLSWEVYDGDDFEADDVDVEGKIERQTLADLLYNVFSMVEDKHKGFVEVGTSDIEEGVYRIRIHEAEA